MKENLNTEKGQATGVLSHFLERVRNTQVARLINDNSSILDLGCGRATLLHALYAMGKTNITYLGVDNSSHIIEHNRRHFPDHRFKELDLCTDDIASALEGTFDTITMVALLEHLPEPENCFLKMKEIVSSKGQIIITTPRRGFEKIYKLGSTVGLFSREAHEEHMERFPDKKFLQKLAYDTGLNLNSHSYFLLYINQIAVFSLSIT